MRQMTGAADELVVSFGREPADNATNGTPEFFGALNGFGLGARGRGDNADRVAEQVGARGCRSGFLRASHRVTADEIGEQRLEFLDDARFYAANVGDDGLDGVSPHQSGNAAGDIA